ncbi:MAG: Negative regulator of mitotic exit [Bogoriella megaspora]|nr:MAG: Negative regulator of mitotic exit [Bogoriella megaspora]
MAFLFKSKKHQNTGLPPASRNITSSDGPGSQIPVANGFSGGEKSRGLQYTPTPGSSVNNSLNSVGGNANTPSPDSKALRERADSEPHNQPVNRNAPPPTFTRETNPYPWSQWRLNFTNNFQNPFPRYGAAANSHASKDGNVYLMGGLINGSTVKGDLWMVEASSASMACYPVQTTSEGPGPRVGHASLLVGNAFIVFGGDTKLDEGDLLDDTLYLLNTSTKQWSRALPAGPRPPGRYGHTLNILGSRIYIFGGQVEGTFYNDLVAFDLNNLQNPNNRWEVLLPNTTDGGPPEGMAPPARTNHTMVTWGDKLYLFGGTDGINWFNDVWTYDPRSNSWTHQECIGYIPAAREGHASALVQDVMYVFGGRTEEGTDLGDLAAFRISTRRWYTFQNMGPAPSPRSGHTMTAYGKQIVVLAGEPSSAPRDPAELSQAYVLDTGKIRYPNDQQIQQTPSGERVQGGRRPSGEQNSRAVTPSGRATPRDGPEDAQRRVVREPAPAVQPPAPRPQEQPTTNFAGSQPSGPPPTSRLPRAANGQGPPGPPPQGQAPQPQPRINGSGPVLTNQRSKTPPTVTRALGPSLDTSRAASSESQNVSPSTREAASNLNTREQSPAQATQQPINSSVQVRQNQPKESFEGATAGFSRSSSRSKRQQPSQDSEDFGFQRPSMDEISSNSRDTDNSLRVGKDLPIDSGLGSSPALTQQNDDVLRELESLRSKNAWYASELALARKSGYAPSENQSFDERGAEAFGDDERPLVEALLKMRNELVRIQSTISSQTGETASRIAEMEKQRDNAINEAVYAKAKLAAHGGSQAGTPQPDGSRGTPDGDRSNEMSRRLASSITAQTELSRKLDGIIQELNAEKRARELAEDTAEAAQKRVGELDLYRQHNASEVESLRGELYEAQRIAREQSANYEEAQGSLKLLAVDKTDLSSKLERALGDANNNSSTLDALHKAVGASSEKSKTLERKLEDERNTRNMLELNLAKLRSQHDEKAAELESTTRKLQDAEELAEKHLLEANTHREAVLSSLNNLRSREVQNVSSANDERVTILQQQVESANAMVKQNQEAANRASEKLRSAEERIAGLESYQEQTSRESLSIRKQLQTALKDTQNHHSERAALQQQLASQQLEANAIAVQHSALRDLLAERGINSADQRRSRALDSPNGIPRFGTPEINRMRELEQQLDASFRSHEDMKAAFEAREIEVSKEWEEKLQALDNDHQAAVKYLRGTEKMLSKMKQELQRYKTQNTELEKELATTQRSLSSRGPENPNWEEERVALQRQLRDMEIRAKDAMSSLETQMIQVQEQLAYVQREHEELSDSHSHTQQQLDAAHSQAAKDFESMKRENQLLEARAQDAEQKVQLLLDQVESSVDNYRRQSQQLLPNGTTSRSGGGGHNRGPSTTTIDTLNSPLSPHSNTPNNIDPTATSSSTSNPSSWTPGHAHSNSLGAESVYSETSTTRPTSSNPGSASEGGSPVDTRNSMALDSLASELDALRTHWETQHKNYRLSERFDFEKTPTSAAAPDGESGFGASWRRGLSDEGEGVDERGGRRGERGGER